MAMYVKGSCLGFETTAIALINTIAEALRTIFLGAPVDMLAQMADVGYGSGCGSHSATR